MDQSKDKSDAHEISHASIKLNYNTIKNCSKRAGISSAVDAYFNENYAY